MLKAKETGMAVICGKKNHQNLFRSAQTTFSYLTIQLIINTVKTKKSLWQMFVQHFMFVQLHVYVEILCIFMFIP